MIRFFNISNLQKISQNLQSRFKANFVYKIIVAQIEFFCYNNFMKMNNLVFATILFSLAAGAKSQTKAVNAPFSKGVNFSDWLERPHAGLVQKNFFCEQDFKDVRELGCDAIRQPVHFENFSSGAGEYKIDPYIFSILDNAIKWAAEQKIF